MISPIHLCQPLAQTGLSFERIRSWKASPDPDYEAEAARILELYEVAPFEGPVISFDQMGPISNVSQNANRWAIASMPSWRPRSQRAVRFAPRRGQE